jgi:hypothetical protein
VTQLKVFRAHLGFFDTIVATTSQRKALEAWGAAPSEFTKGFATVTDDPQAVAAACEKPGTVLRRPFGNKGSFSEEPVVPKLKVSRNGKRDARKKKRTAANAALKRAAAQKKAAKAELAAKLEALDRQERQLAGERQAARAAYRSKVAGAKTV